MLLCRWLSLMGWEREGIISLYTELFVLLKVHKRFGSEIRNWQHVMCKRWCRVFSLPFRTTHKISCSRIVISIGTFWLQHYTFHTQILPLGENEYSWMSYTFKAIDMSNMLIRKPFSKPLRAFWRIDIQKWWFLWSTLYH